MKIPYFSWVFLILIISQILLCKPACGQCLHHERSLLLELKQSLTFNSSVSTKLVQWNVSTEDCCSWNGVTCNKASGHVIGLDLENESIDSEIKSSSTLFRLQALERLNLAFNGFNDTEIPSGLSNLTRLVYLNLSRSFSGQIPDVFSRMEKLVVLDLSDSYSLKVENPKLSIIFQNLTQLSELYLYDVPMLGQGFPESFANLSSLTVLSLQYCNFSGVFPQRILQIPTLQTLDLSYNELLHGPFPEFPQHGSLRHLFLSGTNFSGGLPDSIGNLAFLHEINLNISNFSGKIPQTISNLTQLTRLDFSLNQFSGIIPSFRSSKNLTHIDLSFNKLSGPIPSTHFEGLDDLEHINLSFNTFNGSIPSSLFNIPSLQNFNVYSNHFNGILHNFSSASSSPLQKLTLSRNKLDGPIPPSFFDLNNLELLSLSSNNLSGTIQLESFRKLDKLYVLDLSHNLLSIITSHDDSSTSMFPSLYVLSLASCNLKNFPNLRNQSDLQLLDLSDNHIGGEIPNWIWNISKGSPLGLNLSHNLLTSLQQPYVQPPMGVIDLHSNQLSGEIPIPPAISGHADYSDNNFSSFLPFDIGNNMSYAYFFSASRNNLSGNIPKSICNASYLEVLDLSKNGFSGKIPSCLLQTGHEVLNLGNNRLTGSISGTFEEDCGLETLDLNGNQLEGHVPKSLANCTMLEVLNMGNNDLNDTFPCFIKSSSNLRVLVLRFNSFHGSILCSGTTNHWPNLQILDISSNKFTGKVPQNWFVNWTGMMDGKDDAPLKVDYLSTSTHYLDSVTVSVTVNVKGLQIELVKILTIFNTIDISDNMLEGNVPDMFGELRRLHLLNLSHNTFTGSIPASLGTLKQLEALDFSVNSLSGTIPTTLASLSFLSFLNLSYNQLTGKIPSVFQFSTFDETSFEGNMGLCGIQLNISCVGAENRTSSGSEDGEYFSDKVEWNMISAEIGFFVGFGIVVMPLLFYKRWRTYYYERVDRALSRIFRVHSSQFRRNQGQKRGGRIRTARR